MQLSEIHMLMGAGAGARTRALSARMHSQLAHGQAGLVNTKGIILLEQEVLRKEGEGNAPVD